MPSIRRGTWPWRTNGSPSLTTALESDFEGLPKLHQRVCMLPATLTVTEGLPGRERGVTRLAARFSQEVRGVGIYPRAPAEGNIKGNPALADHLLT